jgi:hypothetical protein
MEGFVPEEEPALLNIPNRSFEEGDVSTVARREGRRK